jgi:hypothetical protein
VLYASRDTDYATAARAAAAQLREHINRYRDELPAVPAFGAAEAERARREEEEEEEARRG